MNIPIKRQDYLDKEIYEIISLVEVADFSPIKKVDYVPFDEDDDIIDLSDKVIGPFITTEKLGSEIVSIKHCDEKHYRELKNEVYKRYEKFIDTVYKTSEIHSLVSRKFLYDLVFKYLIKSHSENRTEGNFSDFLVDNIEKEIKEYKIYFSVENLEIFKPLKIGKVEISKLESNLFIEDNVRQNAESVSQFNKKYRRKVFASCIIRAEKERAIELALKECSLSIDIIKICSDTIDDPKTKISFDIDSRLSESFSAETLVSNINKQNDVNIISRRIPNYHQLTEDYRQRLSMRNLDFFNSFLYRLSDENTELQNLIINAIRRLANALTTTNLNQRIVELFTVMESLLVPNSQANILESLTRYCSKIVHSKREDRISLINLIKKMYEIRSSYVHHALEKDFEIEDLRNLQVIVQCLIGKLIEKSHSNKQKSEILKEIDDAILDAY
jgi:hypothetical protein